MRSDTVVDVIDDRRVPQPHVEFRAEPRLASMLLAAVLVVVAAIPVAAGLRGPSWWVKALVLTMIVVLAAYFARALFSAAVVTGTGIKVKNAFQGELSADWGHVREFQISYRGSGVDCRVTLFDGTKVRIHAFEWPGNMNVLENVRKWLAEYDSPLRQQVQHTWQITFRNDQLR